MRHYCRYASLNQLFYNHVLLFGVGLRADRLVVIEVRLRLFVVFWCVERRHSRANETSEWNLAVQCLQFIRWFCWKRHCLDKRELFFVSLLKLWQLVRVKKTDILMSQVRHFNAEHVFVWELSTLHKLIDCLALYNLVLFRLWFLVSLLKAFRNSAWEINCSHSVRVFWNLDVF